MSQQKTCRACGSAALTPVFSAPVTVSNAAGKRKTKDADFVLCDPSRDARACGLLQAARSGGAVEMEPTGRHSSTRDHLRAVATEALEIISGRDCAALDIGCNDGALLSYYPRWVERFGVDSGAHVEQIGEWAKTERVAFPSSAFDAAFGEQKFDIITAVSTFEHIDDPRGFLSAAKTRLTEDGVFVLETLYAPTILTGNCVEALQAGISGVYSLSALEWLLREEGLKIVKGALTSKEGGSIRLFVTHQENQEFDFDPWSDRLARLWNEENALAMRSNQPYQLFEQRLEEVREAFTQMLDKMAERGETAHILGADARVEALLRWVGPSGKAITAAVDRVMGGERNRLDESALRIISETDCRAAEPDFLIAPTRFKREVLEKWREAILLGARVVFVTPTPHVVTAANYAGEYGKAIAGGDGPAGAETLRAILAAAGGPRLVSDNSDSAQSA